MALDPDVDEGRRAWTICPECDAKPEDGHYMIGYNTSIVCVQCVLCHHVWDWDTRFFRGVQRPE